MELSVLVTGKNKKVVENICEHLEADRGYRPTKCAPSQKALFGALLSELPKMVFICLGDETEETIKAYDVLQNSIRQGNCTVFAITDDECERLFISRTALSKVYFLSRPVSLPALYEKLNEIEKKLAEQKEQKFNAVREFINEVSGSGIKRRHILVVDDDTEQLIHIKEQLEEFYEVTLVKSGKAAFKFLEKRIPDLILLDYMMPEEDGPEVLRELRLDDFYASIPVVFLTGVSEKETILKVISELHPQGYLVKPSKKSEIVAKIIDVLG